MVRRLEYQPVGVCANKIIVEVENGVVQMVEFVGGCPGNTMAVGKLCVGRKIEDVIDILSGIDCRGRGTSCPDQLAKALQELKSCEVDCEELSYAD